MSTAAPASVGPHEDETNMRPIDPHDLVHYLVACQVAGVSLAILGSADLRSLISQLSRLSIPGAVKLLRTGAPCKSPGPQREK
jgi:hypothetical protein